MSWASTEYEINYYPENNKKMNLEQPGTHLEYLFLSDLVEDVYYIDSLNVARLIQSTHAKLNTGVTLIRQITIGHNIKNIRGSTMDEGRKPNIRIDVGLDKLNIKPVYVREFDIVISLAQHVENYDHPYSAAGISETMSKHTISAKASAYEAPLMIKANDPTGIVKLLYVAVNDCVSSVEVDRNLDMPAMCNVTIQHFNKRTSYDISFPELEKNHGIVHRENHDFCISKNSKDIVDFIELRLKTKYYDLHQFYDMTLTRIKENHKEEVDLLKTEKTNAIRQMKIETDNLKNEIYELTKKYEFDIGDRIKDYIKIEETCKREIGELKAALEHSQRLLTEKQKYEDDKRRLDKKEQMDIRKDNSVLRNNLFTFLAVVIPPIVGAICAFYNKNFSITAKS